MKVVVGLGNPGRRYVGTRHNMGFDVLDSLAGSVSGRERFDAIIAEISNGTEKLLLVKPQTFMNRSGRSVREVVDFYQVPLADLLVVCDDINLPLGRLRARARGTHGGHNGLRDVQGHLGTTEYSRLRIGVDLPPPNVPSELWVLDTNKVSGDVNAAGQQLRELLEKNHAEVLAARPWDERRLAYPIKGHKKGLYYLTYFRTEAKNLLNLERECALNETILRQLVIRIDPKLEETMLTIARDEHAYALQAGNPDADDLTGSGGFDDRRRGRRPEPAGR